MMQLIDAYNLHPEETGAGCTFRCGQETRYRSVIENSPPLSWLASILPDTESELGAIAKKTRLDPVFVRLLKLKRVTEIEIQENSLAITAIIAVALTGTWQNRA